MPASVSGGGSTTTVEVTSAGAVVIPGSSAQLDGIRVSLI